jgi:hypothetical protein
MFGYYACAMWLPELYEMLLVGYASSKEAAG